MSNTCKRGEISLKSCPADEFVGRFKERAKLKEIFQLTKEQGQAVMISGRLGSGRSSFLNWAEKVIQSELDEKECPAIKRGFNETPGMVIATYRELIIGLKEYNKFGWFSNVLEDDKVKKYLDISLSLLEKMSSLAGPSSIFINAGVNVARGILPGQNSDYNQLRSSFDSVLKSVSDELIMNNKIMGILLDDIQWSSEPDFKLLKEIIQDIPPRIVLIIAFRLEDKSTDRYKELKTELRRLFYQEISLTGMDYEEIKDLAERRYNLYLDDESARYLSEAIGEPFSLVKCFNLLQRQKLDPLKSNFEKIASEASDFGECIYSCLDPKWRERINYLCLLPMPIHLIVISCMLREDDIIRLKDELDQSLILSNDEDDKERYSFAQPYFREYLKNKMPEIIKKKLSSQAAKCLSKSVAYE